MARAFGPRINVVRSSSKVKPAALQSMFVEGGDINGHAKSLQRDTVKYSRRAAPRRTGLLRRSIQGDRLGTGPLRCRFTVYAWAPHAKWVEKGTGPVIWGRSGYMVQYAGGRRPPAKYAKYKLARQLFVAGQEPNPFLEIGLAEAMAMHGYL